MRTTALPHVSLLSSAPKPSIALANGYTVEYAIGLTLPDENKLGIGQSVITDTLVMYSQTSAVLPTRQVFGRVLYLKQTINQAFSSMDHSFATHVYRGPNGLRQY